MRSSAYVLVSLFAFSLISSACSSSNNNDEDADPFDTLAACYEEHIEEFHDTSKAIVTCCLDHPIAGMKLSCKDTQAACVDHLNTELSSESLAATDIEAACTTYLMQKDM
jgi:hypothetical protein